MLSIVMIAGLFLSGLATIVFFLLELTGVWISKAAIPVSATVGIALYLLLNTMGLFLSSRFLSLAGYILWLWAVPGITFYVMWGSKAPQVFTLALVGWTVLTWSLWVWGRKRWKISNSPDES